MDWTGLNETGTEDRTAPMVKVFWEKVDTRKGIPTLYKIENPSKGVFTKLIFLEKLRSGECPRKTRSTCSRTCILICPEEERGERRKNEHANRG